MVWGAVAPIAAGIGGGLLGGLLAGGDTTTITKETSITTTNAWKKEIHAPYENYQKTETFAPQTTISPIYSVQIESPGAQMTTKKELAAKQDVGATPTISPYEYHQPAITQQPTQSASAQTGTDFTKIAIIAAIAIIGYGLVTGRRR